MSSKDARFVVSALVHAKAVHVTSSIECHRKYGSEAKTNLVNGVVTAVEAVPSAGNKHSVTMITAIYILGGNSRKVAILNSRSVKAGHVRSDQIGINGLVTESGIQKLIDSNNNKCDPPVAVVNNAT